METRYPEQNKLMICHDCRIEIGSNACHAVYATSSGEFAKCESCHTADPVLRNFRKTEVYSRVVGYIRPVEQWNNGKQAEYADRIEYLTA